MATQNSWNNTINSATTITLNGSTVNVSSDAGAATVNLATGAAAKTVTLGSTNTTSKLDLKFGTADFTLASATGTVMSVLNTGETTMPLQPAFLAINSATDSNVTGDGAVYTIICDSEVFDQNADYNNGSGVFTAPVTGRYFLQSSVYIVQASAANTSGNLTMVTSNASYEQNSCYVGLITASGTLKCSTFCDMDSGDTAYVTIMLSGGTKVVDIFGNAAPYTFFSGYLVV